jgi:hypothetical protein
VDHLVDLVHAATVSAHEQQLPEGLLGGRNTPVQQLLEERHASIHLPRVGADLQRLLIRRTHWLDMRGGLHLVQQGKRPGKVPGLLARLQHGVVPAIM